MFTVYAIHAPDADKLSFVSAQMGELGAPTIQVVDCGDYFMALEGSHRLAAAEKLGLTPNFVIHDLDDLINIESFDWYQNSVGQFESTQYLAGEVAGELFGICAVPYKFEGKPY